MRSWTRGLALALVGVLVALPAVAETYTILLKNGTSFTSRYQPEDASWNPDKLIFLNEWGNLLSIDKADVESLTTETENKGFGHVLNSTTIALGWAPNDQLDLDSDEGKAALAADAAAAATAPPPVYNQEQFVEPSQATGLPLSMVGAGGFTPPMGGGSAPEPVPSAPPPPPGQ